MGDGNEDRSGDPLLAAILRIVQGLPGGWAGTAADLLRTLNAEVPPHRRGSGWPKDATRIGHSLTRLAAALADAGVICARAEEGHNNRRMIRLQPASLPESSAADGEAIGTAAGAMARPAGHSAGGLIAALAAVCGLLLMWLLRQPPAVRSPT